MYKIIYSDQVLKKDIPKLSKSVKFTIKSVIETKLNSNPVKFGKPLRYNLKGCRSLRVGGYRVIYRLMDTDVYILIIQHRKDCYNL